MSFADLLVAEPEEELIDSAPRSEKERIQRDTLGRWAGGVLQGADLGVTDLVRDMRDGVRLARILETLRGERVGKVVQKDNIRPLEAKANITLVLDVMKKEGASLGHADTESIRQGKLDAVISVLWAIIRRYQLQSRARILPRKYVISWVNAALHPHRTISNLNTDWNDGTVLRGLVEYCHPGVCPNWHTEKPTDSVSGCESALQLAEGILRVPPVLDPKDMASPDLEEVSIVTYLSAFLRPGGPGHKSVLSWTQRKVGKENVSNLTSDWNDGAVLSSIAVSAGAKVAGWPDINTSDGTSANQNALSAIRMGLELSPLISARDLANPNVDMLGVLSLAAWVRAKSPPEPVPEPAMEFPQAGSARVPVLPRGSGLPSFRGSGAPRDSHRVSYRPSVHFSTGETGEETGEGADYPSTDEGYPDSTARDSQDDPPGDGGEAPEEEESWEHAAPIPLPGMVDPEDGTGPLLHRRKPLGSLDMGQFNTSQRMSSKQSLIAKEIGGPAVEVKSPEFWRMKATATILVDSSLEGSGVIQASAVSPSGSEIPLLQSQVDKFKCHLHFHPSEPGDWEIRILYMDEPVKGSPFIINVYNSGDVTIYKQSGTGSTGTPFIFTVDMSRTRLDDLDIFVLSDGQSIAHTVHSPGDDLGDDLVSGLDPERVRKVSFTPSSRGVHTVNVFSGGRDVSGSPFKVNIVDADVNSIGHPAMLSTDPNSSSTDLAAQILDQHVQHLIPETWVLGSTATLQFDTTPISHGALQVVATAPNGQQAKLPLIQVDHFNHHAIFKPAITGDWNVSVYIGEAQVDGSPFCIRVYEPSNGQVHRLTNSGVVGDPVKFDVDISGCGSDDLDVFVLVEGTRLDHVIEKQDAGKYNVTFIPTKPGDHCVVVYNGGGKVRGSPFKIEVAHSANDAHSVATGAAGVLVTGSGLKRGIINQQNFFLIDTSVSPGPISLGIVGPDGSDVHYVAQQKGEGRVEVAYLPKAPGKYQIEVQQNNEHVTGSPFFPRVEGSTVHIRDLKSCVIVGTLHSFTIDATAAQKGKLDLDSDISIQKFDRPERQLYKVTFTTLKVGIYDLTIKYDGHVIPGCPYQIEAKLQ